MTQLRAEQLEAHLARTLAPIYAVHGDEPLLVLEAADAVRAAARRGGCAEREVLFAGRHFDWATFAHAGASRSLFGGAKLIELRFASGKPGSEGAAAIEHYCAARPEGNVALLTFPRLDRAAQASAWFGALREVGVIVDVWPLERARLPRWIGERISRNGQRAAPAVLEFLAERVEGNLLAAHQEVLKLALLLPPGELSLEQAEDAVANVARYDPADAGAALLAGDLARYQRVVDGLQGEGEAPTRVLWVLAEDLRAVRAIQSGLEAGRPLESLLREHRVWSTRQAPVRSAVRRYPRGALDFALARAAEIDRIIKGVAAGEPWDAFARLGLELVHGSARRREFV